MKIRLARLIPGKYRQAYLNSALKSAVSFGVKHGALDNLDSFVKGVVDSYRAMGFTPDEIITAMRAYTEEINEGR